MVDLEKELGPLINKFNQAKDEMKKQKVEKKQSDEDFKEQFKIFSIEQIKPIMDKYKEFLVSKGQQCQIFVKPSNGYSKWEEPSICLRVGFPSNYASYSEIRFTTKGESISIYQSVFTPSGGGKGGTLGPYKKDEITNDFLEGTLTSFVKSIYDKDWSFSSFPTR